MSPTVIARGRAVAGAPDFFAFEQGYVPLRGRYRLEFSLQHTYSLQETREDTGRWAARSDGYFYQFREHVGPEVLAFHWHPGKRNQPDFPHLHMLTRVGTVAIERRNHVPTGPVSLESVVRFAIAELGVRPLRHDWEQILDEGEQSFTARRSW